jgi:cyanophycinase
MTNRQSRRRLATFVAASLTILPVAAFAQRGTLFIIGGGPQPAPLVKQFVDLAGGSHAKIAIFAEASEDGEKSGVEKADELHALGADARSIWVTREQANTDSVARLLDGVGGIYFGGGDQVKLIKVLRGTKTEAAIRRRYENGAVVGGTSAGAAVMSELMLTGDERHPGGVRRDTTNDFMTIARDNIVLDTGFALIRDAVIDQHFLRRKRHNRLISVVLEHAPHLGAGIDESTALIVHPDGHWSVVGESAVTIYDARSATITPASAGVLGASDLRLHILPAGSSFDPKTGKAVVR